MPSFFEISQAVIAAVAVGVWAYLLIAGRPIPQEVNVMVGVVIGWYFRSAMNKIERTLKARAADVRHRLG